MTVSFSTLDLNLLRVFDAVMEERSVLRASQSVFLSQSAVSHSLARLREMLDDELFIRTTTEMQPTARALAMAGMVRDALKSLEAAIELPKFEPATSTRKFTIAANDFTTMVLASRLLHVLKSEAPHVDLAIKPVTRIDLAEQIDLGQNRRRHRHVPGGAFSIQSDFLFEYDDVLITHASQRLGAVTLEELSEIPIIVVSSGGARGRHRGFHLRTWAGKTIRNVRPGRVRARNVRVETGTENRRSRCPIFRRFRASWTFPDIGDHSAPARRCLRPHRPDRNPRASLSHHPCGSPLALARAPRGDVAQDWLHDVMRRWTSTCARRCYGLGLQSQRKLTAIEA